MAAETWYIANTAIAQLTTANSNLDGTDAVTVLTAGSSGTLVKTVTIKAFMSTTHGMIRLYDYDGTNTKPIYELEVPAVTKASYDPSFEAVIPLNHMLKAAHELRATTQQGSGSLDNFNVIAEGLDWTYYTDMVRPESTNYAANNGMQTISTANSNLDGSGTLSSSIITVGANGTVIQSIVVKAQVSTSLGMVRLFIYNGSNARLFREIKVPAITKSGIAHSFSHRIDFGGMDFALKPGWSLKASTEVGESFNIIVEGLDWVYPDQVFP